MNRTYSDLHLCLDLKDPEQASNVINKASRLGYRLIAVPFTSSHTEEEIRQIRNACQEAKMDIAARIDLRPRTPNELLRGLRKLRRRFEAVAVMCDSKEVSRQAAKDHRVDLLNFPSSDFRRRFFDLAEAELASNSSASLEIDIRPLLITEGTSRIRLLASLRREAQVAQDFHIPIVVSSGVSDKILMRKPMELASLASLFGLSRDLALDSVSKNPAVIVKRNREKLSSQFVAPGIRIVRRGSDC